MVSEPSEGQATMAHSLTGSSGPSLTAPAPSLVPTSAVHQRYGPYPISVKLEETNFLPWKHQALATVKGHKLLSFLDEKIAKPSQFASSSDEAAGIVSDAYAVWEQQDQLLMSWLLSSMSDGMLTMMVGCNHASEVWSRLETFFASQTKAKIKQFKTQLRTLKKGSMKMTEYLLKVKRLVDSLFSIGSPISSADHIDAILDGLPEEYNGFIVSVTSRTDPYTVLEIESLLAAQEERIERYKKDLDSLSTISANVAQSTSSTPRSTTSSSVQTQNSSQSRPFNPSATRGGRGFSNSRGRGRGGRTGGSNRPYCQLCSKPGHLAWQCFQRFNHNFVRPFSPNPYPSSSGPSNAPITAMLATPETVFDPAWYPDSGASNHITSNINNLGNRSPYTGSEQIYLANGTGNPENFDAGHS